MRVTTLVWNNPGDRFFETGIDRGVLYTTDGTGVPWNGLISVKENPTGGESNPYYLDGIRYRNIPSREELEGTIEAFTYPDEFSVHDGSFIYDSGLIVEQQQRLPFGLSYRTRVGNDFLGTDLGYKLHIIYNVLAEPSDKQYSTLTSDVDPLNFSWNFSTTPEKPISKNNIAPLSHVIIDSRKTDPAVLNYIESVLYGDTLQEAALISLNALFRLFDYPILTFVLNPNTATGLALLAATNDSTIGDLIGGEDEGLYSAPPTTRLVPLGVPGFYVLNDSDVPTPTPGTFTLVEDPDDEGTYLGNALVEDTNDEGTYLIASPIVYIDPSDYGTYIY